MVIQAWCNLQSHIFNAWEIRFSCSVLGFCTGFNCIMCDIWSKWQGAHDPHALFLRSIPRVPLRLRAKRHGKDISTRAIETVQVWKFALTVSANICGGNVSSFGSGDRFFYIEHHSSWNAKTTRIREIGKNLALHGWHRPRTCMLINESFHKKRV